jgi:ribosomal protein L11 methyltransferase
MSWKLTALANKADVEAALERRETTIGWDENIVLAGFEVDPDEPDVWRLDAYLEGKPTAVERNAVSALFAGNAPEIVAEELPDTDWVAESQRGIEPIRAGRFHVHTPDYAPANDNGAISFCIPAAQAFGTGQHETTAGCLAMLDAMKSMGVTPRHIADIGTGTGLLAFAAMKLWPHAVVTASDIDPVCLPTVLGNAEMNAIPLGTEKGELAMIIADGMDDEFLAQRAPFDLLIANILAGPLIALAPEFAASTAPRGNILLAGLLTTQERGVRTAYMKAGFRLQAKIVNGDWSILWLRHRFCG